MHWHFWPLTRICQTVFVKTFVRWLIFSRIIQKLPRLDFGLFRSPSSASDLMGLKCWRLYINVVFSGWGQVLESFAKLVPIPKNPVFKANIKCIFGLSSNFLESLVQITEWSCWKNPWQTYVLKSCQIAEWSCWKTLCKPICDLFMMSTPWFDDILICKAFWWCLTIWECS